VSPVNPFFNFTTFTSEQTLVEDLIVESIQIYGHSVYYVPRDDVNIDRLFGEDPLSSWTSAHEIEVYLKSNIQFQGASETFSKFGLIIEDDATFVVAVRRFNATFPLLPRPRENDIIFIEMQSPISGVPFKRYLFEIRFVEDKEQLFQLGKLYTYELQCQLMNYGQERVQTSVPELNEVVERDAYTIDIAFTSGLGTYANGEIAYQGTSFINATAQGTVVNWNANTNTLSVQTIVGDFANGVPVIGVTSNANYTVAATPDTSPKARDPQSDNDLLSQQAPAVVLPITNPRFGS